VWSNLGIVRFLLSKGKLRLWAKHWAGDQTRGQRERAGEGVGFDKKKFGGDGRLQKDKFGPKGKPNSLGFTVIKGGGRKGENRRPIRPQPAKRKQSKKEKAKSSKGGVRT